MPIARELRPFYRTAEWLEARARVLNRAANCCEQCRKPNGERVFVVTRPATAEMYWSFGGALWRDRHGRPAPLIPRSAEIRRIRVKIGVAHLDHNPQNNSDVNLRALCDFCHLAHDANHHKLTRSLHKDQRRPLLEVSIC